ncbi:DoxX family membrane protein [Patescibacteria group bacterium]|nr:DoxX family membrane protein [Patescibacteria group bacterium]
MLLKPTWRRLAGLFVSVFGAVLSLPGIASAHEVYVLSSSSIAEAIATPSFNILAVIGREAPRFLIWAGIAIALVATVYLISMWPALGERLGPLFKRIKRYGPLIARFTIGISFLACAYYQATFGPELPFSSTFGPLSGLITIVFAVLGVLAILGLWVRPAAFTALVIFGCTVWSHGIYMLTYANYLGEMIVLLIMGTHEFGLDSLIARRRQAGLPAAKSSWLSRTQQYLVPRSFMFLRVLFGAALIYASAYAKIIHNNLALFTVEQYHLDKLLGFSPHFLVVGAALVEIAIGLFFILGFEIRFTAVFLLFWLTLSLIFFGEIVWPHLILIGIPIAYIFYGYDRYSLGGYLSRKRRYEPVL